MDDESGYDVLEELDAETPVPQVEDEYAIPQLDDEFHDTERMEVAAVREDTYLGWPPAPPLPAEVELAQGTVDSHPPVRKAGMFAAVRRPTTNSETDD
ncbi:MAG TPA: hypothetical protein VFV99_06455 [Kofleriaceae bacterium]|nr:hypothetical protein [Kofleriaceae bacterium]